MHFAPIELTPGEPSVANRAPPSLTTWRLVGFAAPIFPFAGQEIAFKVFLPVYLAQTTTLSIATIAAVILIFRVWDTVNDPLIGWLSDRWRWGHPRLAPMLAGVLPAMIGAGAVLLLPIKSLPELTALLVVSALGWTLVNVPHGAWALERVADPVQRTRVFAARQLVGLVALPLFALGPSVLEHVYGADLHRDAAILAAIICVSLPVSLAVLVASSPRAARFPAPHAAPKVDRRALWRAFTSRASLRLLALFACLGLHNGAFDGLLMFWVRDSLHLPDWAWTVILVQALAGLAAVPLWVRLQARHGTWPALRFSLLASLVVALAVAAVPAGRVGWLIALMIGQGLVAGSTFMFLRTLLGDHFEAVAAQTGHNLAGTLYSGFHLAFNLAVAVALPGSLLVIGALGFESRGAHRGVWAGGDPVTLGLVLGGAVPFLIAWLLARDRLPRKIAKNRTVVT